MSSSSSSSFSPLSLTPKLSFRFLSPPEFETFRGNAAGERIHFMVWHTPHFFIRPLIPSAAVLAKIQEGGVPDEISGKFLGGNEDVTNLCEVLGVSAHSESDATAAQSSWERVKQFVERDIARVFAGNPFAGYGVFDKYSGELVGRVVFEPGLFPLEPTAAVPADAYSAVTPEGVDETGAKGQAPAEAQIDLFISPSSDSEQEIERRFHELVKASVAFGDLLLTQGVRQQGERVRRFIVLFPCNLADVSATEQKIFEMQRRVFESLDFVPGGILYPRTTDPRNSTDLTRIVLIRDLGGAPQRRSNITASSIV